MKLWQCLVKLIKLKKILIFVNESGWYFTKLSNIYKFFIKSNIGPSVEEYFEVHIFPMVVTENLLSLHLSCPSVSVIENFKVPICPNVPVIGIFKSVFVPGTKGSRMTSLHMSQYFPVSQYFPEYYQHCLVRHLQISLWEMIRQLLSQCLFWERTHFPSISHYSQSILRILPSDILGMFQ